MKIGIVGLPNVGKSTLFNSLTKAGAQSANYPFCTIDPNVGIVMVPDERLGVLTNMNQSEKTIPAVIEFVDIAGLVKGASKGEGLGNQFLANIREVDAIVHVVRCFEDDGVVHVEGSVDPIRDIETICLELIFSDLEFLEKKMAKISKGAKNEKKLQAELQFLERLKEYMEKSEEGTLSLAKNFRVEEEEEVEWLSALNLLTYKPVIYAANVSEEELAEEAHANELVKRVMEYAQREGSEAFVVSARLEQELAELDEEEKKAFISEMGLKESGLEKLIRASYRLLGLISFLTAGPKETRAWTIRKGTKAPQAAGKIHSDFEKGFIRAEVVNYEDLVRLGSEQAAKEKGLVRLEGKDYVIRDGDVVLFRFNV